jgi:ATP-dependent DNA helicase RecG
MVISVDELNRLLNSVENERLEFKAARTEFSSDKVTKYCVALANEGGGRLILGVSDKFPRSVVGTSAFPNLNKLKAHISQHLPFRIDAQELLANEKRVVIIEIPSRPVGAAYQIEGAYWMRVGEELKPMNDDALRRIFNEVREPFEKRDATQVIDAETISALLDVQAYFDQMKLPQPATRDAAIAKFIDDRLVRKVADGFVITNLGALLFAKDLNKFDTLRHKSARVTVYQGANKLNIMRDQVGAKGYAIGFARLVGYINNQLPANEVIGQALRNDVRMYPEIAIRELVANALIHQDLDVSGMSVDIEIYSDRIVISNPGRPIISEDRFIDGYQSRNELLADMMRRLGICEEMGSGIDRVISNIEIFQLPALDFRMEPGRTSAILYAHKEFKVMNKQDKIRACYQHCCLRYVTNLPTNNESVRERFKLTVAQSETATRIITETMEAGKIRLANPESKSKKIRPYVPYWA